MGLFSGKNKNNAQSEPHADKTAKDSNDPIMSVHPDVRDLLWIENGPHKNWTEEQGVSPLGLGNIVVDYVSSRPSEPSLINFDYEIKYVNSDEVEKPDYNPSYSKLTPEQRGVYWSFLKDPFTGGFDISYVFLFYYGLERHLFKGNI